MPKRPNGDGLTPKERRFAEAYIKCLNATQAYREAVPDCAESTIRMSGCVLLTKPNVRTFINKALNILTEDAGMRVLEVLEELKIIGKSDLSHYIINDDGHVTLSADAPENAMRAIASVERSVVHKGSGESRSTTYKVRVRLWDKNKALADAGKYLGMFVDRSKVEVETTDTTSKTLPVDELDLDLNVRRALLEALRKKKEKDAAKTTK